MDDKIVFGVESNCYIKVLKFVEFKIIYNDNKVFFYIKIVDYIDIICCEFIMFV